MSSVKIRFSDLVVELEGTEPNQELADRALNMISFLVQERLLYDEMSPAEEDDSGSIPPQPVSSPILPIEVQRAYL